MERVNRILDNFQYQEYFNKIQSLETNRAFCGHTMEHFLDVARLSFIMVLEVGLKIDKEIVYATALLHDIGRYLEYTNETPHHEGSAIIAREILPECGFNEEEQAVIIEAIINHRQQQDEKTFSMIFYQADKLSRSCFSCPVQEQCNWPLEKKNMKVTI
jgi:uncharacterized domain HDIG